MKRCTELETVRNNVKVLSDMLATYRPNNTSSDEVELMKVSKFAGRPMLETN